MDDKVGVFMNGKKDFIWAVTLGHTTVVQRPVWGAIRRTRKSSCRKPGARGDSSDFVTASLFIGYGRSGVNGLSPYITSGAAREGVRRVIENILKSTNSMPMIIQAPAFQMRRCSRPKPTKSSHDFSTCDRSSRFGKPSSRETPLTRQSPL
jgi:hypothetical protein